MSDSNQKYALISGASSGIGYQLAIVLSKKGYKVLGSAPEKLLWEMNPLKEEYGVIPFACDITSVEEIKKGAEFVKQQTGGRLDILYNNAGISVGGPSVEIDDDDLERLFKINTLGHIYMTKYMIDFVIAAKGTIVYTSSVCARCPLSWVGAYCATKSAIDSYASVLRMEMKPFGVRVHSVITGGVDTAICDSNVKVSMAGSRYDVPGVLESLRSSAMMSRDLNISAEDYAKQVVAVITKKSDPGFNIYRGARSYFLHWVSRFVPLWLVEYGIARHFKQLVVLRNLKKAVDAKDRKKRKLA
ncbi:uncharacterized protein RJT21DRAFT_16480 [Scheffersomyces amazonensis]|uniref:uncharacterized protein n=1 Tax=Scheffersomyces amazonensis TaxID=1078765 RepID=UPI00315D4210